MSSSHALPTTRQVPLSQRVLSPPPARTLADAFRLCDPFMPLDPVVDTSLRAELDRIRGGNRLAKIALRIRRAGGTASLQFLSGHVGSGKTTELLRLRERLSHPEGDQPANTVLFLDADAMLDRYDVDLEDIVMALWSLVLDAAPVAAVRALGDVWRDQIGSTLRQLVVNLPDKLPDAVGTVLGQLRLPGLEQRRKLRDGVGSVLTPLIAGLNGALTKIRHEPTDSIVLLIDNLEKVGHARREVVERLYLERLGALRSLDAHVVVTVPLYLCYSQVGPSLTSLHGDNLVVLPMIMVRRRSAEGGGDHAQGLAAMVEILEKRVSFRDLFSDGSAAAERIARLSGGCIRHGLSIVQDAVNEHEAPPVTAASIERAAANLQAYFERALPESWLPHLHAVARNNQFPQGCPEDDKREMLRHLYVLEYQNGEPEAWYGVHPLVERCRKYRSYRPE